MQDYIIQRLRNSAHFLIDPLSRIISMICVPGKGFWKFADRGNGKIWEKLNSNDPLDHIAWFIACTSVLTCMFKDKADILKIALKWE